MCVVTSPKSEQARLDEIRAWRARMRVGPDMRGVSRSEAAMDLTGEEDDEVTVIAVFQHTLDDYDFLLGMIDSYGLGR